MSLTRMRRSVLWLAYLVSGVPGLAAQLAWARVFTAGLGHEWPALVGVVSGFFIGLAFGSWSLDSVVSRSCRPARWYGGLECFSAAWIAGTTPLLPWCNELAMSWSGSGASGLGQGMVAFLVPLCVVGPAAAAMGGTLPAMDRAVAPWLANRRAVSLLYGLNTAGAVAGVWLAVHWWMPRWGFSGTLMIASLLQLACGSAGFLAPAGGHEKKEGKAERERREVGSLKTARLGVLALGTGLLGLGYELVGIRVLAQVTDNTLQTYATALMVFLAGTAAGGLAMRWAEARTRRPALETLLTFLAVACVGSHWALVGLNEARDALIRSMGARAWEVVLSVGMFLVPTVAMGAVFGWIVQAARGADGGVGRLAGLNTLGAACAGPMVVGWLVPLFGPQWALGVIALGYFGLSAGRWDWRWWVGCVVVVGGTLGLPREAYWLDLSPADTLIRHDDGRLASVSVVRSADGNRVLRVNGHFQQGGTATAVAAQRHAHLPLLIHPSPQRALFLGVGTGITTGAGTQHPGLQIDAVELLPEVLEALPAFQPENAGLPENPRVRFYQADARRFVRGTTNTYDVIIADLFHPSEDGAGFLYTREHFTAIRDRLGPGGWFWQWLPLHQLDLASVGDIARTFLAVFPEASLWLLRSNVDVPVLGLAGTLGRQEVEVSGLEARVRAEPLVGELAAVGLANGVRVLGNQLGGTAGVERLSAAGQVATDDRPLVLFRSVSGDLVHPQGAAARLMTVLDVVNPVFSEVVAGPVPLEWMERLKAFRRARDLHLRGLAEELEGNRTGALGRYLESAGESVDYSAGYAQALLIAASRAQVDPAAARAILERLKAIRPEQRMAAEMLERLEGETRGP